SGGRRRWARLKLLHSEAASPHPPPAEDTWVRPLRPRRRLASADVRRRILQATARPPDLALFGVPWQLTRASAYLLPATGERSLATVIVAAQGIRFSGWNRDGQGETDIRVRLPLPGFAEQRLPVKDHHLLLRVEKSAGDLASRLRALDAAIQEMGDQVAVRLGLSRPFAAKADGSDAFCWVMADGFFSLRDPQ